MRESGAGAYPSVLALHGLKAQVRLGVGEEERARPQDVAIDVRLYLPQLLSSTDDDNGAYICYHGLSEKIRALCAAKEYRLIEYLTHEIYRLLRGEVPQEVRIAVHLTKPRLPISYVEGGASYTYTDLPPFSWVPQE